MTKTGDNKKPRVATVFLVDETGAVLLQHRDNKPGLSRAGMWVTPGGHCECEEDFSKCAVREMFEETNYQCDTLHFLKIIEDDAGAGHIYPLAIFWCLFDGKQQIECHEGQALRFVSRKEANDYDMPQNLRDAWDEILEAARLKLR